MLLINSVIGNRFTKTAYMLAGVRQNRVLSILDVMVDLAQPAGIE
jgi:vacuolar-type H+-ATPase subunit F/Vma7